MSCVTSRLLNDDIPFCSYLAHTASGPVLSPQRQAWFSFGKTSRHALINTASQYDTIDQSQSAARDVSFRVSE